MRFRSSGWGTTKPAPRRSANVSMAPTSASTCASVTEGTLAISGGIAVDVAELAASVATEDVAVDDVTVDLLVLVFMGITFLRRSARSRPRPSGASSGVTFRVGASRPTRTNLAEVRDPFGTRVGAFPKPVRVPAGDPYEGPGDDPDESVSELDAARVEQRRGARRRRDAGSRSRSAGS